MNAYNTHVIFPFPFHGKVKCGGVEEEIHDGVAVIKLTPDEVVEVESHEYGSYQFKLPHDVPTRIEAPVSEPFKLHYEQRHPRKEQPRAIVRVGSQYWKQILSVVLSVLVLGILSQISVVKEALVPLSFAFSSVSVWVYMTAQILVNAFDALLRGERGALEDLWAPIGLAFWLFVISLADMWVRDQVREMANPEDWYVNWGIFMGLGYGVFVYAMWRAITVQRVAKQLDLSPLIAYSGVVLGLFQAGMLNNIGIAPVLFHLVIFIVSLVREGLKNYLWIVCAVVLGVILVWTGFSAATLFWFGIGILGVILWGVIARDNYLDDNGIPPEIRGQVRASEFFPMYILEGSVAIWYWIPHFEELFSKIAAMLPGIT